MPAPCTSFPAGVSPGLPSLARFHPTPCAQSPCCHLVPSPSRGARPAARWCSGMWGVLEATARLPLCQAAPAVEPARG